MNTAYATTTISFDERSLFDRVFDLSRRAVDMLVMWQAPSMQRPSLRADVVAPFREIGGGRDEKTAYKVTKDWYRSSGGRWTQGLS